MVILMLARALRLRWNPRERVRNDRDGGARIRANPLRDLARASRVATAIPFRGRGPPMIPRDAHTKFTPKGRGTVKRARRGVR